MSEPECTTAERIALVNAFTDAINAAYNEDFLPNSSINWALLAEERGDKACGRR